MMLQQDAPEDYVVATGVAHSVRECLEIAFDQAGLEHRRSRRDRPVAEAPGRGRSSDRRRLEGQARAGLGAADELRAADPADGRRRPRAAQRRRAAWPSAQLGRERARSRPSSSALACRADAARRALITGITGQDGSFLAELLLARGYDVTGVMRVERRRRLGCSEHLRGRIELVHGDLLDPRRAGRRGRRACARTSSITWPRRPSCRTLGGDPAATLAAIAGSTAALLEAVARAQRPTPACLSPAPARSSAPLRRARSARTRRAGRRPHTRPPSSPPTSLWPAPHP